MEASGNYVGCELIDVYASGIITSSSVRSSCLTLDEIVQTK